jgi:hypothetical protein
MIFTIEQILAFLFLFGNVSITAFFSMRRKIVSRGIIIFVGIGSLLALLRVLICINVSYHMKNHLMTYWVSVSALFLVPETFFVQYLPYEIQETNSIFAVLIPVLAVGSYLWTLPLLFINSKRKAK